MPINLDQILDIMARLRAPKTGCPWDLEQTFLSIAPYTIEEAYEVADAIEQGDMDALRDELGDLLFQVVFHARMAEEAGHFDFAAVVQAIADKMVRRHPNVFGDETVTSASDQTDRWEEQKSRERATLAANKGGQASALDNVPKALPALTRAEKIGNRAARVGFDWPDTSDVFRKIDEEIGEVHGAISSGDAEQVADEVGDLLFAVTNLARHLGTDPEVSLRRATAKFDRRFREMEKNYADEGRKMAEASLEELELCWQTVKKNTVL
jgi:MazG family protein